MMHFKRPTIAYTIACLAIVSWWYVAFRHSFDGATQTQFVDTQFPDLYEDISLSRLRRKTLLNALNGNYALMAKMIFDWEIDACLLESKGVNPIKHLPRHDLYLSQKLAREIKKVNTLKPQPRFLPQTYASASILLALLPPEQIAALPQGLKDEVQLHPVEQTSKIPLTIDRHHSEDLFIAKPAAAFVSPYYSHPAMLEALTKQGIKIVPLQTAKNVHDIQNMVNLIGHAVNRPQQAKLLALFIEASLMAIDNRLAAFGIHKSQPLDALYLAYYSRYYLPSPSTPTWDLLQRLHLTPKEFSHPLDQEDLLKLDPEYLIISSDTPSAVRYPLNQLKAAKQGHIFHVSDKVQQSPTQYIVLAYYDIAQALAQMPIGTL